MVVIISSKVKIINKKKIVILKQQKKMEKDSRGACVVEDLTNLLATL